MIKSMHEKVKQQMFVTVVPCRIAQTRYFKKNVLLFKHLNIEVYISYGI